MGVSHRSFLPEPLTIELMILLVILLTSCNYLVIWSQNRRQIGLLWMLAGSLLSSLAFILRLTLPPHSGIIIPTASILVGLSCTWMGCRVATGRTPWLPSLIIPAGVWLIVCCIPGFLHVPSARFALAFLLVAALLALALREFWPAASAPGETTPSFARWLVTALLAVEAFVCLAWGSAQAVSLVYDLGIGSDVVDLPVAAFTLLGFSLIMSFAFVALVKEQSERALSQTAQHDALTGLGNRRHLDESLEKAVSTARRTGAPLAFIMIDVDQFKAYNDRYGHPAGDACLRAVAVALRGNLIRREDEVSRYGGEEFAVVLANARAAEAVAIADRLRLGVRALNLPHAARAEGIVTISLGVAAMAAGEPGAATITDVATLVAAADDALYRAKASGRDRVESFMDPVAGPVPSILPTAALRLDPA